MNPKITKKISYFAPIGLALYWLILLKESAMPESKEGFILQSGYIKYLLGWIGIFLLSVGLAYIHYKWVFLKLSIIILLLFDTYGALGYLCWCGLFLSSYNFEQGTLEDI
jgi:hypothetical protein